MVTLFSIWVLLDSSSCFHCAVACCPDAALLTSAVMAATFIVRSLMVSAGVSASGFDAGTASIASCPSGSPVQDFRVTNTSIKQHAAGEKGRVGYWLRSS